MTNVKEAVIVLGGAVLVGGGLIWLLSQPAMSRLSQQLGFRPRYQRAPVYQYVAPVVVAVPPRPRKVSGFF